MTTTDVDLTTRVLRAVAKAEACEALVWTVADDEIAFFVDCTDAFEWGGTDLQPVTAGNVEALERSVEDTHTVTGGDGTYALSLFCARVRGLRPQAAAYPTDARLWELFDACGPDRAGGRSTVLADSPTVDLAAYAVSPEVTQ